MQSLLGGDLLENQKDERALEGLVKLQHLRSTDRQRKTTKSLLYRFAL